MRENPNVSNAEEFSNYSTDSEKFNLGNSELDVIIKFEIISDGSNTRSWESIDEKYGRVSAY